MFEDDDGPMVDDQGVPDSFATCLLDIEELERMVRLTFAMQQKCLQGRRKRPVWGAPILEVSARVLMPRAAFLGALARMTRGLSSEIPKYDLANMPAASEAAQ